MRPMIIYTNNKGNSNNTQAGVTSSVDYLPLLAEFEIYGTRTNANTYEQNYQKQYAYYSAGNSKVKYRHSATGSTAYWRGRSPYYGNGTYFCSTSTSGATVGSTYARLSYGLAPIFRVGGEIVFTINGTPYTAQQGMTWAEWCDSSYDSGGYTLSGATAHVCEEVNNNFLYYGSNKVPGADVIVSGGAYTHDTGHSSPEPV